MAIADCSGNAIAMDFGAISPITKCKNVTTSNDRINDPLSESHAKKKKPRKRPLRQKQKRKRSVSVKKKLHRIPQLQPRPQNLRTTRTQIPVPTTKTAPPHVKREQHQFTEENLDMEPTWIVTAMALAANKPCVFRANRSDSFCLFILT